MKAFLHSFQVIFPAGVGDGAARDGRAGATAVGIIPFWVNYISLWSESF